jgi:hypothetical protein
MTILRTHVALALGVTLAAPGCAGRIGMIAFEGAGSTCLVIKKPKKIVVNTKNFSDRYLGMAWVIHNACASEAKVTIPPIKKGSDPVLACEPADSEVKVPAGQVRVIACVVKPMADSQSTEGRYSYSIKLNDKEIDPDLIIKRK